MHVRLHEGEENPLRGWLPSSHTRFVPAPQLSLERDRMTEQGLEIVTVLLPFGAGDPPQVAAEAAGPQGQHPGKLTLQWHDGHSDTLYWTADMRFMLGEVEGIKTDGSLLHRERDAQGRAVRGVAVAATFVEPGGTLPSPGMISFDR
jgi:hypothetical protein